MIAYLGEHQFDKRWVMGDKNTYNAKLYNIWLQMKKRCYRKENSNYKWYGAKGIIVCLEWHTYKTFKEWAIEKGYKEGLSIDRINNNGNYEPSNCRWVTKAEQGKNTSRITYYTVLGETHSLSEWARILHRGRSSVYEGIKRKGIDYIIKRLNK